MFCERIDAAASGDGERLAVAVGTSDFTQRAYTQKQRRVKGTQQTHCFFIHLHSLQQAHGERSPACPHRGHVDRMPFATAAPLDAFHSGLIGWPMAPKHALLSSSCSGGPGVGGVNNTGDPRFSSPTAWFLNAGMVAVCSPRNGKRMRALDGTLARRVVAVGAVLMLMIQSSLAAEGKTLMLCFLPTC